MTTANIIEIFCFLDEFCKYFEPELKNVRFPPPESCIVTVPDACLTAKS